MIVSFLVISAVIATSMCCTVLSLFYELYFILYLGFLCFVSNPNVSSDAFDTEMALANSGDLLDNSSDFGIWSAWP